MRRFVCLVLTAAFVFGLICSSSAISYSDRGRYYLYITSTDTPIYTRSEATDENGQTSSVFTATGSLPAGTPISAGEIVEDIYQKVVYMDQSGSTHTVIISKDAVRSNYVTLDFGGSVGKVRIPRPAAANASFIRDYLNYRGISVSDSDISSALGIFSSEATEAPIAEGQVAEENDTFPQTTPDENAAEPTPSPTPGKTDSKKSRATATPQPSRDAVSADSLLYLVRDGDRIPVTLVELGTVRSTVSANGETLTVATDSLVWTTNAEGSERLAVVYAPKTGQASLRKTVKTGSKILKKVRVGTIVRVFDIQSKATGVYVGDTAGYILNTALRFIEPVSSYTTGHLTYNGSLTNTHRINLYSQAKESSRKIMGVHAGAEITILSQKDPWTEIDIDGYHGYVLSKFVTPDEETVPLSDLDQVSAPEESEEDLIEEDVIDEEESYDEDAADEDSDAV